MKSFTEDEKSFRLFAGNLELAIDKYSDMPEETLLVRQRRQLKLLIKLENKFRRALIKHAWGAGVYKDFIALILDQRRNILAARPYFRERQSIFSSKISLALKKRHERGLFPFKFNHSFILFVLGARKWPSNSDVVKISKQINAIRTEIMELNLPLAISQARFFWGSTPRSHLSYMDLVQIHCGGLLVAIDKFVPPDTSKMTEEEELQAYRSFRAVAIGRMMGDRISEASSPSSGIHQYPLDSRKIYRANKAKRRMDESNLDYDKIVAYVNEGVIDPAHKTTVEEISQLLASNSCVSGDIRIEPDGETTLERCESDMDTRPDLQTEHFNAVLTVRNKIKDLCVLDIKLLRLYGIQIDSEP